MRLVAVARGAASPRASARDEVVAISRPRHDEGAYSMLGMVAVGVDRPLGRLWVDLCRLDALGILASLRG